MRRYIGQILFFILLIFCALSYPQSVNTKNLLNTYKDFYVWQEPKNNLPVSDSILTVLGRWAWGPNLAVDADSNFAYIGNGPTFHVLDISDPSSPEIVGEYLTDGFVYYIEVKDSLAFASIGRGLLILDITNPLKPEKISEVEIGGVAISLALDDSFVYVTTFSGVMWVVDISDINNPYKRGAIPAGGQLAFSVEAKDRYVYIGNPEYPPMVIVDANNPDTLSRVDFEVGGWGLSAHIKNTLLFIGVHGYYGTNYLKIYNISNASDPEFIGEVGIQAPEDIMAITISKNGLIAYIVTTSGKVYSLDISNLTQPEIIGEYEKQIGVSVGNTGIAITQNTLFAAYYSGLLSLDVSEPDSLKLQSFFPTGGTALEMDSKDNLVFVASGLSGIWILDFSNPQKIENIANVITGGSSVNIIVDDNYAYVYNWNLYSSENDSLRGLWIIDINNPYQPKVLTHYIGSTSLSSPHSIAKSGNFLFITQTSSAESDTILAIIDVNDILNPKQISVLTGNYYPHNIAVEDSILYLATFDAGLRIIKISEPENLIEISNILNSASGVTFRKPYVYTSTSDFSIINVDDPYNPFVVSSINTHYGASKVDLIVSGDYAYWADGKLGVIDISNPESPIQIATFNAIDYGSAVVADSEKIFFADGVEGIWVIKNNLITDVKETIPNIIDKYKLYQNYPNPFNASTKIKYAFPPSPNTSKGGSFFQLKIYDVLGRKVVTLVNEEKPAGSYEVNFNANGLSSRIYFYRLTAGGKSITKKMVIIK